MLKLYIIYIYIYLYIYIYIYTYIYEISINIIKAHTYDLRKLHGDLQREGYRSTRPQ